MQTVEEMFKKLIAMSESQEITPAMPIDQKILEDGLKASMNSPAKRREMNPRGEFVRDIEVNRVEHYEIFEEKVWKRKPAVKFVAIRTTAGAWFNMPLHVGVEQAINILNGCYSLEISFEEPEEDIEPEKKPLGLKKAA